MNTLQLCRSAALALSAAAVLALPPGALAKPKVSSTGQSCTETGTTTRTGKDQDGNKWTCTWDYCSWSECSTSGSAVNNCVKKTEYSNARDCKAAAGVRPGTRIPNFKGKLMMKSQ